MPKRNPAIVQAYATGCYSMMLSNLSVQPTHWVQKPAPFQRAQLATVPLLTQCKTTTPYCKLIANLHDASIQSPFGLRQPSRPS